MSVFEDGVDTIIYTGEISRDGYEKITKVCEEAKERFPSHEKANLVLYTYGGDPHAAFRIARSLQHHYPKEVRLFIPHYCKSAGTLIAIGASELIISDMGELGPLDVQLIKSTEMFERSSGMDITQGIEALRAQSIETFKNFVVDLRIGTKLSTKIATEIATALTTGLFSPIFAQIDPSRVGEIQRATYIAFKYGQILSHKFNNITHDEVRKLVIEYPSHSFVIDRKEARDIFKKVRCPDDIEEEVLKNIDLVMREWLESDSIKCLLWEDPTKSKENNDANNESSNIDDIPAAERASGCDEESHSRKERLSSLNGQISDGSNPQND